MTVNLSDWGWDMGWEKSSRELLGGSAPQGVVPGRVIADSRHLLHVVAPSGTSWCRPSGNLSSRLAGTSDFPVTGDWVLVEAREEYTEWPVLEVLPRRSVLSRKAPQSDDHKAVEEHVLAANIDYVFVVCGLDGGRAVVGHASGAKLRDVLEHLALVGGVAFDRGHEVRDQVVPALQFRVNVAP